MDEIKEYRKKIVKSNKEYFNSVEKCKKLINKCFTTQNVMLSSDNAEWHIDNQIVKFLADNGGKEYLYEECGDYYIGEKLEKALTYLVHERKIFKDSRKIKFRLDYKTCLSAWCEKSFMAYPAR